MIDVGKMRALILVVIFAFATTYASFCSTTCTFGICPNQERHSASHDCEHPSPHHPGSYHHHGPEKSDCSIHHHPSVNLVKADDLRQFQLNDTGQIIINNDLLSVPSGASTDSLNASWLSDLAPPPILKDPLYQQISVLRI
jgi:hypothetical protein